MIISLTLISIIVIPVLSSYQSVEGLKSADQNNSDKVIEGEYIVKFKKEVTKNQKYTTISDYGGSIEGELKKGALKVKVQPLKEEHFFKKIREDKRIKWYEPNRIIEIDQLPNDQNWSSQWGPEKIAADQAWDMELGNHEVLVVVIDTGVCYDHPDLALNYIAGGYDWVNDDDDPFDDHGHGTHCAGIIAAAINNEMGIAGLAQVNIMAEKFIGIDGKGSSWDAAKAIEHAIDTGKVISDRIILSNSWGSASISYAVEDAIDYAYQSGALIVAAAGNSGTSPPLYPSAFPEVISVSATDSNDNLADFNNFGDEVELAAPGVSIYSTYLNYSYEFKSGTSMACPHVSGTAALIWSHYPLYSSEQVRIVLQNSAEDLGETGWDLHYGYGRINAYKAVQGSKPHDLRVTKVIIPKLIFTNSTTKISGTVQNIGSNNEYSVYAQLISNDTILETKILSEIDICESTNVIFNWSPPDIGSYNITVYVLPADGEDFISNNWASKIASVKESCRILIVSDDDGLYSTSNTSVNEFTSTLTKHGYDFDIWNESIQGRPSLELLSQFRLVIWTCTGHYNWAVDPTDAEALTAYLSSGGSIILEGDDIAFDHRSDNFMVQVAHATYEVDSNKADGLSVTNPEHPVCTNLPTSFEWEREPGWEDGTNPINGGVEVMRYKNTTYSAIVASGEGGPCSTVYVSFPIGCLSNNIREKIILNSVEWLLGPISVKIVLKDLENIDLKAYIDKISYAIPAEIALPEGIYNFAAWPSLMDGNSEYYFDHWEDDKGVIISDEISFDHYIFENVTLSICYEEIMPCNISISTSDIGDINVGKEFLLNATIYNNGPQPLNDVLVKLRYPSDVGIQVIEDECVSLESILSAEFHIVTWHITANESGTLRLIVTANGRNQDGCPIIDVERIKKDVSN